MAAGPTLRTRGENLGRFSALLVTLTAVFAAAPFLEDRTEGVSAISVPFTFLLLVGLYVVSGGRRRVLVAGFGLMLPALVLEWLSNFVVSPPLVLANLVFVGLFILYVAAVVLREVLEEQRVTLDTIFGGICIYLLVGIAWVMAYAAIEFWQPGSFLVGDQTLQSLHGEQVRFPEFLYYSFVTMTTLGYGDIVAQSPPARACSTAEAIVGQLYIAIFVARLVGLHLAHEIRGR